MYLYSSLSCGDSGGAEYGVSCGVGRGAYGAYTHNVQDQDHHLALQDTNIEIDLTPKALYNGSIQIDPPPFHRLELITLKEGLSTQPE